MLQPQEKKPNRLQALLETFQQFRIGRQRSSSPAPCFYSQTATSPTAVIAAASAAAAMAPVKRDEKRTDLLKKHKRQVSHRATLNPGGPASVLNFLF
jgi:hypothetical protein